MHKAGSGIVKKTSLAKYALQELPEELHPEFFRGVSDELMTAAFEVNPELIKAQLGRHIFETTDGVIISAPTELIGETVKLRTQDDSRTIQYKGVVKKEKIEKSKSRKGNLDNKTDDADSVRQ